MSDKLENAHILIDVPLPLVTPRLTLNAVQPGDGAHRTETGALADLHTYYRVSPVGLPPLTVKWGPP